MRVHVDPAGRHHQPRGIDLAPGRSLLAADPGDPAFCNGNVAAECGLAGAIHDRAATNNDVVHCQPPAWDRAAEAAQKPIFRWTNIAGRSGGKPGLVDAVFVPCRDTTPISTTREVGRLLLRTD